jgi:hypothetical protein
MRFLGLLAFLTLLASTALFAQHTVTIPSPPPPVHTTAPAPTVTTPAAIHTGASAPHVTVPHVSAPTSHSVAQTSRLATVKTNVARTSDAKPNPEKRGFFSWFRKREPVGSNSQDRRKEKARRNPSPDYLALQFPPSTPHVHHGCTIVPVSNPAIPCNPFAPCCD